MGLGMDWGGIGAAMGLGWSSDGIGVALGWSGIGIGAAMGLGWGGWAVGGLWVLEGGGSVSEDPPFPPPPLRALPVCSLDLEQEIDPLSVDHFCCTPLVSAPPPNSCPIDMWGEGGGRALSAVTPN